MLFLLRKNYSDDSYFNYQHSKIVAWVSIHKKNHQKKSNGKNNKVKEEAKQERINFLIHSSRIENKIKRCNWKLQSKIPREIPTDCYEYSIQFIIICGANNQSAHVYYARVVEKTFNLLSWGEYR